MSYIYETMYILRPDIGEESLEQTIEQYQAILRDQSAEQIDVQHRGRRRLAYDIQKHREGIYIQMNYQASGDCVAVLERAMRLSDDVIRYLTIKQEVRDIPQSPVEAEV